MLSFIFALAAPAQGQSPAAPSPIVSLLPLIFIGFIFYFLLIRPQQQRQKEHQKMVMNLKKNDEVITNGGIHGTIVAVKDKTFVLRVDDNVKMEVEKSSIAAVKKSRS